MDGTESRRERLRRLPLWLKFLAALILCLGAWHAGEENYLARVFPSLVGYANPWLLTTRVFAASLAFQSLGAYLGYRLAWIPGAFGGAVLGWLFVWPPWIAP